MKLYYVPRTRAGRARWMLEELGVPYQLVRLDPSKKENRQPDYLAVHPLGHVPALTDGDTHLIESAAIVMYLADKFADKKLAPAPGTAERGQYYQWISFAMTTVEPPLVDIMMHTRFLPEDQRNPKALEKARERLKEVCTMIEKRLEGRQFVAGNQFTAADLVLGGVLGWGAMMGAITGYPNIERYVKSIQDRPAYKKANAD